MSTPISKTSKALEGILKALQLLNTLKPILDQALDNEAERLGLTRAERKALNDRLTADTNAITTEDMSDNP